MAHQTQNRIKMLIQQTNDVFENCGGVNTDYADFAATIALSDFKALLGNTEITDRQLKRLIRIASQRYCKDKTPISWSAFTAAYINKKANGNLQTV
ncbi:MAG: hypothetical protein GW778_06175 [Alphaproteobacteria bacterium]|nr:hypothetical protein [Alphaproteobacteria bacterium]